jgi:hypothetical protein
VTVSLHEMRQAVAIFLDAIGERMTTSGQMTLHFSDGGQFVRYELNRVHRPSADLPLRRPRDGDRS